MHKRIKFILPQMLLTLAALTIYMPDSHAFGSYGTTVNATCLAFNGTQPYAGDCTLCHNPSPAPKLPGKTLPFSWWQNQLADPTLLNNFCPPQTNPLPNGVISTPANNATINMGTVAFTATSSYTGTNLPLTYAWNFGGAAANSTVQNPSVVLTTAGTFTVTFTVTDSKGFADPTPATITLVVKDPNANQAPNGTITSPAGNSTINIGGTVGFVGTGTDPDNNTPLNYAWDFGGGTTNSALQSPTVIFNTAGIYSVALTVTDSKGLSDPTPDLRTVTVGGGTTASSCIDKDHDNFNAKGDAICGPIDCNDNNAAINPGAIEVCSDKIDNDCNKLVDNNDPYCKGGDCVAQLLNKIEITSASWQQEDRKLAVSGPWTTAGATVKLTDTLLGSALGTATTTTLGWSFNLEELGMAPCRVRVEINGRSGERDVAYAPSNCSGKPAATNNPPVANADSATTLQNAPVSIAVLANDTDLDKDSLSIIVFTQPGHGVVTQNGLILVYKPTSGYSGSDSFTYTISDGHGGTAKATVSITVQPAPSIPIKAVIGSATWNSSDKKLSVSGSGGVTGASVKLLNATTKATLGTTTAQDNGLWTKSIEKPSVVPCKVRVEITKGTQTGYTEKAVANAPRTCK